MYRPLYTRSSGHFRSSRCKFEGAVAELKDTELLSNAADDDKGYKGMGEFQNETGVR